MRTWKIASGLLVLLLICALGVWLLLPGWLSRGEPAHAPAPDFSQSSGWIMAPGETPPAVWETGWAIDFFVLPPVPATLQRHGTVSTVDGEARTAIQAQTSEITNLLSQHGAVYMPALRMPSAAQRTPDYRPAATDLDSALRQYLDADNRGRAIVPVFLPGSGALAPTLANVLSSAPQNVSERVPMLLQAGADLPEELGLLAPRITLETSDARTLPALARLPNAPAATGFADPQHAADTLGTAVEDAYRHLDENVAPRAEPLGDFEVIEVSPIRRPGETNDAEPE